MLYMPVVSLLVVCWEQQALLHARNATVASSSPLTPTDIPHEQLEDQKLFLPHELDELNLTLCTLDLAKTKECLCNAQLHNSLNKLCVQLHMKTRLVTFKNCNVHHQKHYMQNCGQLLVNEAKIKAFANKYHAA